ncbi:phosphoglycerate kinase [Pontibacter sp. G13]|uniref:phosphoglycerate kinase n=1 Tax=Pontibacter sp. G13 TaxID=3074898 RepID=UPI002889310F|nr:phosphoglycerate kinase [Pontibacter sp. G13]WNJ16428.1 phosphoglycerate kinase [Pontibacter sp. G13]
MKFITDAPVAGRRALIRVDFNVPLNQDLEVTDDRRVREAIPTIKHILENGGSCVLMSHLGRPKDGPEDKFSLRHVISTLQKYVDAEVKFADDCVGAEALELATNLQPGQILLLENLRFYKEEKKGDAEFAMKLAKYGDYYVNDAFGTAHRAHASTYTVAKLFEEKYCGLLLKKEIENADKVMNSDARPVCAIMGGAKVSDKIMIIESLMDKVDYILIGGGMAYTFLRAKGYKVGKSLMEEDKITVAAQLLKTAVAKNTKILTPVDSVCSDVFGEDGKVAVVRNEEFPDDMMGLDIGPETFQYYYDTIMDSKVILWNGPMGVFEMEKFSKGTQAVGEAIVDATKKGAFSLIGGGDSAAAVAKFGMEDDVSYVSTGGGALLEYLEGKVLPGIEALG